MRGDRFTTVRLILEISEYENVQYSRGRNGTPMGGVVDLNNIPN